MTGSALFSANVLIAYTAYFVGTASPGPSNLAIMSTAAQQGRRSALVFALGIVTGSMCWAIVATLGVSAMLLAWSQFIVAIKMFGGLYLLWLAFKSGRSALAAPAEPSPKADPTRPLASLYTRGLLLHLTNPKAILVWVSIVALSSSKSHGAPPVALIPGCAIIGWTVFGSYALLFSTNAARRTYLRTRRVMEGGLAIVFGLAGIRLLTSHV